MTRTTTGRRSDPVYEKLVAANAECRIAHSRILEQLEVFTRRLPVFRYHVHLAGICQPLCNVVRISTNWDASITGRQYPWTAMWPPEYRIPQHPCLIFSDTLVRQPDHTPYRKMVPIDEISDIEPVENMWADPSRAYAQLRTILHEESAEFAVPRSADEMLRVVIEESRKNCAWDIRIRRTEIMQSLLSVHQSIRNYNLRFTLLVATFDEAQEVLGGRTVKVFRKDSATTLSGPCRVAAQQDGRHSWRSPNFGIYVGKTLVELPKIERLVLG